MPWLTRVFALLGLLASALLLLGAGADWTGGSVGGGGAVRLACWSYTAFPSGVTNGVCIPQDGTNIAILNGDCSLAQAANSQSVYFKGLQDGTKITRIVHTALADPAATADCDNSLVQAATSGNSPTVLSGPHNFPTSTTGVGDELVIDVDITYSSANPLGVFIEENTTNGCNATDEYKTQVCIDGTLP